MESTSKFREELIEIKRDSLDKDIKMFKLTQELQLVLGSVKNDTHSIKNTQDKSNLIVMSIVFMCGIVFGTQFDNWSPFIVDIYNTFKIVKG